MDASDFAIDVIILQENENGRKTWYQTSFSLLIRLKKPSVTDKELLALIKWIERYFHYLLEAQFVLRNDHRALAYLWEAKNPSSRLLCRSLRIQEYTFKVEYIKGVKT